MESMGLSGRMEDTAPEWRTGKSQEWNGQQRWSSLEDHDRLQLLLGDLPNSTEQEDYYLRRMFLLTLKNWGLGTVSDHWTSLYAINWVQEWSDRKICKTLRRQTLLKRQYTRSAVTEKDRYSGSFTTQNSTAAQRGKQMYPVMNPLHPVKAKAMCSRGMKAHVIDQKSSPKGLLPNLFTLKLFHTWKTK